MPLERINPFYKHFMSTSHNLVATPVSSTIECLEMTSPLDKPGLTIAIDL